MVFHKNALQAIKSHKKALEAIKQHKNALRAIHRHKKALGERLFNMVPDIRHEEGGGRGSGGRDVTWPIGKKISSQTYHLSRKQ